MTAEGGRFVVDGGTPLGRIEQIDRVEIRDASAATEPLVFVVDLIPTSGSYVAANADGTAVLSCLVRCLLTYEGALRFKATLQPTADGIALIGAAVSRAHEDKTARGVALNLNASAPIDIGLIRTRDREGAAVSIAEYLLEHCTWDRTITVKIAPLVPGTSSLRFERRVAPVRADQSLAGLPFNANDLRRFAGMRELTIAQQLSATRIDRDGPVVWRVEVAPLDPCYVREQWNELVASPYLRSLQMVQQAQALSFMPVWIAWTPASAKSSWTLVCHVHDEKRDLGPLTERDFDEGDGQANPSAGALKVRFHALRPMDDVVLTARGRLDGFKTDTGVPIEILCDLKAVKPRGASREELPGMIYGAELHRGTSPGTARLGALDLDIGGALPSLEPGTVVHRYEVRLVMTPGWRRARLSRPVVDLPSVRIESHVPVRAVKPGGTDSLPDEQYVPLDAQGELPEQDATIEEKFRREPPVVLPLPKEGATQPTVQNSDSAPWLLQVSEGTGAPPQVAVSGAPTSVASHTVRLRLQTSPELARQLADVTQQPDRVIVIDRQPFTVALVEYQPFSQQALAAGVNEIANWTNADPEGARWQIATFDEPFDFVLPPQAVGEAMEKAKTLDPDKPVDFRFSPPARQRVFSSYFRQSYAEAPWNLRRILGYPGQRAPGAELRTLQYELLYGLSCSVELPFLRFAETMSLLGWIPGRMRGTLNWRPRDSKGGTDDIRRYGRRRQQWADIYQQYLSRLAIYEPWDTHRADRNADSRAPLSLSEGVSCELRRRADLYYSAALPPGAPDDAFVINEQGLKGGATFPFEVPQFYTLTLKHDEATSAELKGAALSALGGWGFTKATFGNTSIYADVAMGRAYSITLERLGRIGVFWNLAKHVIVYERAVVPSLQFASKQHPLVGLPVLRKVREYVEILEPRVELTHGQSKAPAPGFVRAIDFTEQRQINVNSEWGSVVGTQGWRIPLWRRGEQPQEVYPKPAVRFEFAADEGGRPVALPQTIDEPDKLQFYSAFSNEAPASWPAVPTVDFADVPAPSPSAREFADGSTRQVSPDDPLQPPGLHAFTFRVVPSDWPANLVSGRIDRALSAVIDNVTMMRGAGAIVAPLGAEASPTKKAHAAATSLYPALRDFVTEAKRELQQATSLGDAAVGALCARVRAGVASVRSHVDNAATALQLPALDAIKQLVHTAEERALAEYWRRLDEAAIDGRRELRAGITRAVNEAIPPGAVATANQISDIVRRELAGVQERLTLTRANAELLLRFVERAQTALRACREEYAQALAAASKSLEALRADLKVERFDQLDRQLRRALQQLRLVVQEATSGWFPYAAELFATRVLKEYEDASREARGLVIAATADVNAAIARLQRVLTVLPDFAPIDAAYGGTIVLQAIATRITAVATEFEKSAEALSARIKSEQLTAQRAADEVAKAVDAAWETAFRPLLADSARTDVLKRITGATGQALNALDPLLRGALKATSAVDSYLERLEKCDASTVAALLSATPIGEALQATNELVERVVSGLPIETPVLEGAASEAVHLLRAFGKPPNVPDLEFERKTIAYYFDSANREIGLTPTLAKVRTAVDDASRALSSLGTKFPTINLLDRCIPPDLQKFNLSDVLPDVAGLQLPGLFKNLKLPKAANEHVNITHGVDPQTRRAWVQADVNFRLERPAEVFAIGPVRLDLQEGSFNARTRLEGELGGTMTRRTSGSIYGRWSLQIGETPLVAFTKTTLSFDDGGSLNFDVSPDRIEMSAVLKFLNDLLKKLVAKSGFTLGVLPDGFQSSLDLPAPNLQGGMFGIANLRLVLLFGLRLRDVDFDDGFAFIVGFGIGTKERPFTLSVFILGGAGYVTVSLKYAPGSAKPPICTVNIGIFASASLALSLPAISGGVYVYFGITVNYATSGVDAGLSMGILFQINGEVCVLGFIQVWVSLRLEARYEGGTLVGRGRLTVSIKIGFFDVEFSVGVEYKLGGGSGGSSSRFVPDTVIAANRALAEPFFDQVPPRRAPAFVPADRRRFREAAEEYLDMLV